MKRRKEPHSFSSTSAIDCEFCKGTGKALSLGLVAGVINLCNHCNGLGQIDLEHGPYHVDIVIQEFQLRVGQQQKTINSIRQHSHYKDPRTEINNNGQFGACKAD